MQEAVSVRGLRKTFKLSAKQQRISHTKDKTKEALRDLTFDVRAGEVFGLLGSNGAGKTTTLRILSTLIKPDAGEAFVCGASVTENPEAVRRVIGFLTSELKLEEVFTPNYLFDFFSELHGVAPQVRDERRRNMFARFGIDEFAEVKVADLSTGMKQKLSIVISLVHDPDVIIFDEPTNGLDVVTARTVEAYLGELKERGKTVILSTHVFSLVEKVCDRVGIIVDGRMATCGTLEEVCGGQSLEDAFFERYVSIMGVAS